MICTVSVEVIMVILQTKYLSSWLWSISLFKKKNYMGMCLPLVRSILTFTNQDLYNFGREQLDNATHQRYKLQALRFHTRIFLLKFFLYKSISLEWNQFRPQFHDLNNFGWGLLNNSTNQISKPKALYFQTRRLFMFFFPRLKFHN